MTTILADLEKSPSPTEKGEYVLWRDFDPRERGGILGFVDDLLERLVRDRTRLYWVRDFVTELPIAKGGESRTIHFPFRMYRDVIARLAAISDADATKDPFYPYRGVGSFTDPRWPHVRFDVDFDNRKDSPRLDLTPVFSSEPQ